MFTVISFSLSIPFAASCKFWHIVFQFSFISKYFLTTFVISSLTIGLFRTYMWIYQILSFLESCFIAWHLIYPREFFHINLRRMCILLVWYSDIKYSFNVQLAYIAVKVVNFSDDNLSSLSILYPNCVIEVSNYYYWMDYFSQILSVFASGILMSCYQD